MSNFHQVRDFSNLLHSVFGDDIRVEIDKKSLAIIFTPIRRSGHSNKVLARIAAVNALLPETKIRAVYSGYSWRIFTLSVL